jgi:hypothetical protein
MGITRQWSNEAVCGENHSASMISIPDGFEDYWKRKPSILVKNNSISVFKSTRNRIAKWEKETMSRPHIKGITRNALRSAKKHRISRIKKNKILPLIFEVWKKHSRHISFIDNTTLTFEVKQFSKKSKKRYL